MHAKLRAVVERRNYRLQDIQLRKAGGVFRPKKLRKALYNIVWDDPTSLASRPTSDRPRGLSAEAPLGAKEEPQAPSFPVAIGEGSHPFPFRTRKLSPLPPMVLRG